MPRKINFSLLTFYLQLFLILKKYKTKNGFIVVQVEQPACFLCADKNNTVLLLDRDENVSPIILIGIVFLHQGLLTNFYWGPF